jgi:hypothetical protein
MFGILEISVGATLHFTIISLMLVYFGFSKGYEDKPRMLWMIFVIALLDFFLPGLFIIISPNFAIETIPMLFVGVLLFVEMFDPTNFSKFVFILYVIILIIQLVGIQAIQAQANVDEVEGNEDAIKNRLDFINPMTWVNKIRQDLNRSLIAASGQQVSQEQQGQVSKDVRQEGIELEVPKDSKNERFYINQLPSLRFTLKALDLSNEEGESLDVALSCEAKRSDVRYKVGTVAPSPTYKIRSGRSTMVYCNFDEEFERGAYVAEMMATHNFETRLWTRRYLIADTESDPKDLLSGRDLKVDINMNYAPVSISLSHDIIDNIDSAIVFDLSQGENIKSSFGYTIKNEMKSKGGEIDQINNIEIYLPRGMELAGEDCRPYQMIFRGTDEEGIFNIYELATKDIRNIGDELRQNCQYQVSASNLGSMFNTGPVITRQIKINANYVYTLKEENTFRVISTQI